MNWRRKAQGGAAVLIVLIALLIILYVLFLPPAERAALLGEEPPTPDGAAPDANRSDVIFSTVPRIAPQEGPEVRTLPSFTVQTVTSGNVLAERQALSVERSVFHNDGEAVTFALPDNAENVLLSFTVTQGSGSLRISLNGEQIYDAAVSSRQPGPITLPTTLLEQRNELAFSVSGVGFAVWEKNAYRLRTVRVTADVTSFDEAEQTHRFVLSDKDRLERVTLSFVPECYEAAGKLSAALNGQLVFANTVRCGQDVQQDLALSRLQEGENTLSWSVDEGRYLIDDPRVTIHKESRSGQETFSISPELFNKIFSQGGDVLLKLSFRQAGAQGQIRLNGQPLNFRTHKQSFAAPVTQYVRQGQNTIELVDSSADVTALEVLHGRR